MSSKSYEGFTLVEMLVVMGILIILMTMGIAAGRFAIQRANRVQHQNAADQLYQGLQAYYADNREFPSPWTGFGDALGTGGFMEQYVDNKSFDGGSDATFYYATSTDKQSVLVCVSFGGLEDATDQGGYCAGNGFGTVAGGLVSKKVMDGTEFAPAVDENAGFVGSDWKAATKSF